MRSNAAGRASRASASKVNLTSFCGSRVTRRTISRQRSWLSGRTAWRLLATACADTARKTGDPPPDGLPWLATTYTIILLDWMLPKRSGIAVCKAVRAARPQVPILMLTALDGIEEQIKGLGAGADDYLPKPFDPKLLMARVQALFRAAAQESDSPAEVLKRVNRGFDVAIGLLERLLGVHHACAGHFAQLLHIGDGEIGHGSFLCKYWGAGPRYGDARRASVGL